MSSPVTATYSERSRDNVNVRLGMTGNLCAVP